MTQRSHIIVSALGACLACGTVNEPGTNDGNANGGSETGMSRRLLIFEAAVRWFECSGGSRLLVNEGCLFSAPNGLDEVGHSFAAA